jgi:hypothetical protein
VRGWTPWGVFTGSEKETRPLTIPEIRRLRADRDAAIAEAFKQTKSIYLTRKLLGFAYTRDVVRGAITRAGLYNKCKRETFLVKNANRRQNRKGYLSRCLSVTHPVEVKLQLELAKALAENSIWFEREKLVPGCQMRADLIGKLWAVETKVNCCSQSLITAMAQAFIYRRHLQKPRVCVVIPEDIDPGEFYRAELLAHDVPIFKPSEFISWVKTVELNA